MSHRLVVLSALAGLAVVPQLGSPSYADSAPDAVQAAEHCRRTLDS